MLDLASRGTMDHCNTKLSLNASRRNVMHPVLKFGIALLVTLAFFLFWDRAEIASFRATAYNNSGLAAKAKRDLDRAFTDYNEAIRLRPRSAPAHYNRGNAFSSKGDFESAIADYNQVIRLHPKHAPGFANRGRTFFYAGSFA